MAVRHFAQGQKGSVSEMALERAPCLAHVFRCAWSRLKYNTASGNLRFGMWPAAMVSMHGLHGRFVQGSLCIWQRQTWPRRSGAQQGLDRLAVAHRIGLQKAPAPPMHAGEVFSSDQKAVAREEHAALLACRAGRDCRALARCGLGLAVVRSFAFSTRGLGRSRLFSCAVSKLPSSDLIIPASAAQRAEP